LYLGPDENVTNELISWIGNRAIQRGHPYPNTFMSSKPSSGINHKQYGVTSEGVAVFLDVALKHLGIDPKQTGFTVKLTGGPDGDVAGNMIKILHREYGDQARIVAIADGSGVAEDMDGKDGGGCMTSLNKISSNVMSNERPCLMTGLNHQELLHLASEALPIVEFHRSKLSKNGCVLSVNDAAELAPGVKVVNLSGGSGGGQSALGVKARNTMHFRVQSDVFIPAGGRPYTINDGNWRNFLLADGRTPSSRLIVEGANIFVSISVFEKQRLNATRPMAL
jgi:glutamate dehydrogenase